MVVPGTIARSSLRPSPILNSPTFGPTTPTRPKNLKGTAFDNSTLQMGPLFESGTYSRKRYDVGGLTDDSSKWPKYSTSETPYWEPYGSSGARVQNGIVFPVQGQLPTVNPPRSRYDSPYFMEPTWQSGSTDVDDYYVRNCSVDYRGTLSYEGPHRRCSSKNPQNCWATQGGYKWMVVTPTGGSVSSQNHGSTNDFTSIVSQLLKEGRELPPWARRGKHSVAAFPHIRRACPPRT